jgi:hypothetical protein
MSNTTWIAALALLAIGITCAVWSIYLGWADKGSETGGSA